MRHTSKKFIFSFLICLLFIIGTYGILSFCNFFQDTVTIINNHIYSRLLPKDTFKSTYTPKFNFDNDMPITKVTGVTLNILNENNIKNTPMLLKAQRYYIPVNFICNKLNYAIEKLDNSLLLTNGDHQISLNNNSFKKDSIDGSLRGNLINSNNDYYLSISDIENIFDLFAVFDFENKSISLLPSNVTKPQEPFVKISKKVALVRFEDFGAGDSNMSDKNQTKVKLMADLLYSQGIKFHVGWIPRFKAPTDNFDNNLLAENNIKNVGFIDLLDYLINHGCQVGLHGYTHQSGNDRSAVGEELSKNVNNTVEATRNVVESGIDVASALNIPITFYESPHYRDTKLQQEVIEDYFQFIYEPYDNSKRNIYKTENNHLYVPTPLGFVQDPNNLSSIIDGLKKNDPTTLHSFFYHPSIELDFIDFNITNNKLNVNYDKNSPLQRIAKAINDNGYTTIHINELMDK